MMTKEEARALLPKVGDVLMETPTIDDTSATTTVRPAKRCTVVAVNTAHLWYEVEFENGIRECYTVPKLKPRSQGGIL